MEESARQKKSGWYCYMTGGQLLKHYPCHRTLQFQANIDMNGLNLSIRIKSVLAQFPSNA